MVQVVLPPEGGEQEQLILLEQYATATKTKVLTSPSDLDTKAEMRDVAFLHEV